MKTLVLVTGAPGVGKSTLAVPLAERLGLPIVAKDVIKEALADSLGLGDRDWSRRLGATTYEVMFALAACMPAAVLESNFAPASAPSLLALHPRPIEVWCRCDPHEASRRFAARDRHPIHVQRTLDPVAAAAWRPLDLGGPLLEVDTSRPVDVDAVATWVRAQT